MCAYLWYAHELGLNHTANRLTKQLISDGKIKIEIETDTDDFLGFDEEEQTREAQGNDGGTDGADLPCSYCESSPKKLHSMRNMYLTSQRPDFRAAKFFENTTWAQWQLEIFSELNRINTARSSSRFRNYQHWLVTSIPGDQIYEGDGVVDYIGAVPPRHTGLPHYVSLV
uniref:Uncharacterized protein n=1 Tax=Glossina austeni TaxID=7395 RepID=A0A1A9UTL9_GLOAU